MVTRNGIWVSRMRKRNAGNSSPRAVQACFFWIFFFAVSTGGAVGFVAVVVMSLFLVLSLRCEKSKG